ncbi:unnamed protein product [Brassicogethes aeneus]|uniref:Transducin beta-like protein 2 n=1 Tax=Brassicogethes aeneus TaxID=1431903 RepID=A0A9P0BI76_BRAAE|nr:unnamed protein product [Brassicogethes aeneus]
MDYSSNGKYLASCGYDKAVFLWDIKDLAQSNHKSLRVNTEYNWPIFVKWSPDSKAFIIYRQPNDVEVYKVEKKKDGWLGSATKALHFPTPHNDDVVGMSIASNGKFIMTCSKDNNLMVWDLKGQTLANLDTYLMSTVCAKISPCGRFIVASGFAPHVTVWEVIFKNNEFQEVKRVFELIGHTSGVYDVAFDVDTSHMATVSKDGTWKLYDTKIEYKRGEDPRVRTTGKYQTIGNTAKIALSPNAEVVVISASSTLYFFSALTGVLDMKIDNVFSNGPISNLMFDSTGNYVFASGERHIRVFHNITGYKCAIEDSKDKLKKNQTSATKERLQKIIDESQKMLDMVEEKQKALKTK